MYAAGCNDRHMISVTSARPPVIVIQSRLASSRLPAKALLPIAGKSTVVLCALRAANTGLKVIVATSDGPSDDAIAEDLAAAGITCFRGPHDDVLLRYVLATKHLDDSTFIVRLTADNLFPDGSFVQQLINEFEFLGVDYLGTGSPQDGLPYGMSAEVFTAAALRLAHDKARAPEDKEHVTPWIKRHCYAKLYACPEALSHWSRLRCTLDDFEDYESLHYVFKTVDDPVTAPWMDLIARLTAVTPLGDAPRCPFKVLPDGRVRCALTLGTAQMGSSYGIANATGMPGDDEARLLLRSAMESGINSIDTARAYGNAEDRIGTLLPAGFLDRTLIVTKLDVLREDGNASHRKDVENAVDASIYKSLHHLRRRRLDALLLHQWGHRLSWNGAVWDRLLELRRLGVLGVIGGSVSSPAEAIDALNDPDVGQLQCPVNILDWRWRGREFLEAVNARPDVEIHARSSLLQGLLTLKADDWPGICGFDAREIYAALDRWVEVLNRLDRIDLCIAYVRALPWVTSIVLGMETLAQLRRNLTLFQMPVLTQEQAHAVAESIPCVPEAVLNPSLWRPLNA
jgi:spore coat polysaccharide biosynthesis protein SpsF (cytidylyltransferase family)/aryl-alcohol dehydrogenase-like predicted oxidoreductase